MMTLDPQPALFDVTTPPVRAPKRAPAGTGKPKWSSYTPKGHVPCDFCMAVLAEANGNAPASRPARWKRVQDGVDLLLCYGHAEPRRAADDAAAAAEVGR